MFKLFHKKLNKKGFTLAELLVVIAILAILIAIAVPVFTHMVAEANLRVNQANVHSVRSAAVAHILTHMGEPDDSNGDDGPRLNSEIGVPGSGWVATAQVDNNGNISSLQVYVVEGSTGTPTTNPIGALREGIGLTTPSGTSGVKYYTDNANQDTADKKFYVLSDTVDSPFATVKPSMGKAPTGTGSGASDAKVYYVQAIVTDLDPDND